MEKNKLKKIQLRVSELNKKLILLKFFDKLKSKTKKDYKIYNLIVKIKKDKYKLTIFKTKKVVLTENVSKYVLYKYLNIDYKLYKSIYGRLPEYKIDWVNEKEIVVYDIEVLVEK